MRRMIGSILLSVGLLSMLYAQGDSALLNKDFRFTDGAYTSWTALQTNQPTHSLASLDGQLVLQADAYLLKVEQLYPKGRPDLPYELEALPIICLNGLPYVHAYQDAERGFTIYAGLRVRGSLSYYAYEVPTQDTVLIQAYNPYNGQPFRQQHVVKPGTELREYLLKLGTGEVWEYNLPNLLEAISDDPALVKSLRTRNPEEARERMQKVILIYDDRHPLFLPSVVDKE